ncbi:unnamed protein product [Trichogramma brassicae]|uniref:Uncharacterized protein n=1 Tax=Trichogramma brassicae TaxID=86971 RepID=A0A6H5IGV3_9HYME|nr:unnamed protein product [Trichogramma brassicae]
MEARRSLWAQRELRGYISLIIGEKSARFAARTSYSRASVRNKRATCSTIE